MTIATPLTMVLVALVAIADLEAADPADVSSTSAASTMIVHPQPKLSHATPTYTVTVPGHGEQDRRVESLLDTPLPAGGFTFEGESLKDLASLLRERLGIDVAFDRKSLEGFDLEEPACIGASAGSTYRHMLRACLRGDDLTYHVVDGRILITTAEGAAMRQTIVVYPLPTDCVPAELCDLIQRVIQPTKWDLQGGPGSIVFVPHANSLIVLQTQDVHEELQDLLRNGFDQDLGPTPVPGKVDTRPRAVRAHAVPDATIRRELEETLVDICNAHLGPDADPSATLRAVGELLIVESSSRPFQVHATEMIRAIVGIEVAKPLPGIGPAQGFCWVAREVYGAVDPRWVAVRRWMRAEAPAWLRWLYANHGRSFAGWLRFRPVAKAAVRAAMDRVLEVD